VTPSTKSAVAFLAVVSVCAVLITPAFDELPSSLPHVLDHILALTVTPIPSAIQTDINLHTPTNAAVRHRHDEDFLYLMCTLLC